MPTPYETLTFCQKCAPTGSVQQALAKLYNDMHKAGESDDAITLGLLDATIDGLRHGNWPR